MGILKGDEFLKLAQKHLDDNVKGNSVAISVRIVNDIAISIETQHGSSRVVGGVAFDIIRLLEVS